MRERRAVEAKGQDFSATANVEDTDRERISSQSVRGRSAVQNNAQRMRQIGRYRLLGLTILMFVVGILLFKKYSDIVISRTARVRRGKTPKMADWEVELMQQIQQKHLERSTGEQAGMAEAWRAQLSKEGKALSLPSPKRAGDGKAMPLVFPDEIPTIELIGMGERQNLRAGDTYVLDYRVTGLREVAQHAGRMGLMLRVNASVDLFWIQVTRNVLLGHVGHAVIDLPLGDHALSFHLLLNAKTPLIDSPKYTVSVVQRRGFLADHASAVSDPPPSPLSSSSSGPAATASGPAASGQWTPPRDGECKWSALCRVLSDFGAHAPVGFFLTSWTLLGLREWGWFLPWRGDHRWDKGAANPHARFNAHKTPWKDTVFVGVLASELASLAPPHANLSLQVQNLTSHLHKFRTALNASVWKAQPLRGDSAVGHTLVLVHTLGFNLEIQVVYGGGGSGGGCWTASHLNTPLHRTRLSPFSLGWVGAFGGRFRVPQPLSAHLNDLFGPFHHHLYAPSKLDLPLPSSAHHLLSSSQRLPPPSPADCLPLPPGLGAEWEHPRRSGHPPPSAPLHKTFRVLLCPAPLLPPGGDISPASPVLAPPKGHVLIERLLDCDASRPAPVLLEKELERAVRESIGPDEISVEFEGAELLFLRQQHLGGCTYKFDYNVSVGGLYLLRVRLLRQHYAALDEFQYHHPEVHFDDLLGLTSAWVAFALPLAPAPAPAPQASLPPCNYTASGETARGRWVWRGGGEAGGGEGRGGGRALFLASPYVACPKALRDRRVPEFRAGGSGRTWIVDPRQFEWLPYECQEREVRGREAGGCLGGKRILFSGDSHMRVHFNAVLKEACNITSAAQKGFHTSQCHLLPAESPCPHATLCLDHNMLGWMDASLNVGQWDVIVANVGQHAAAGAEHWPVGEYGRHVSAFLSALKLQMKAQTVSPTRLIWFATPAMVVVRDEVVRGSLDWRTNPRLALYDLQARAVLSELGRELGAWRVGVQDAFNLTLPMVEAAAGDCGHFLPENIQHAAVKQFLNLLCPLPPTP